MTVGTGRGREKERETRARSVKYLFIYVVSYIPFLLLLSSPYLLPNDKRFDAGGNFVLVGILRFTPASTGDRPKARTFFRDEKCLGSLSRGGGGQDSDLSCVGIYGNGSSVSASEICDRFSWE